MKRRDVALPGQSFKFAHHLLRLASSTGETVRASKGGHHSRSAIEAPGCLQFRNPFRQPAQLNISHPQDVVSWRKIRLTVIGQFAQAIVSRQIKHNEFAIRTSVPSVEVSWQVTGVRRDAWANKDRIPVEADKKEGERGLYLHPDAFGQPAELG